MLDTQFKCTLVSAMVQQPQEWNFSVTNKQNLYAKLNTHSQFGDRLALYTGCTYNVGGKKPLRGQFTLSYTYILSA